MYCIYKHFIFHITITTLLFSITNGFFLTWGSNENRPQPVKQQWVSPPSPYTYQQRLLQPQSYSLQADLGHSPLAHAASMSIPAIPIQIPLQAQLTPAANIQNVELVPCMCPYTARDPTEKLTDSNNYQISANPNK